MARNVAIRAEAETLSTPAAVSVDDTAGGTLVLAANAQRRACVIQPTDGDIAIGKSGVAFDDGIVVASGDTFTDAYSTAAWYAIADAAATVDVRVLEVD